MGECPAGVVAGVVLPDPIFAAVAVWHLGAKT